MKTTSWVIRVKQSGKVILETFDRKKVDALNTAKYEAVLSTTRPLSVTSRQRGSSGGVLYLGGRVHFSTYPPDTNRIWAWSCADSSRIISRPPTA